MYKVSSMNNDGEIKDKRTSINGQRDGKSRINSTWKRGRRTKRIGRKEGGRKKMRETELAYGPG